LAEVCGFENPEGFDHAIADSGEAGDATLLLIFPIMEPDPREGNPCPPSKRAFFLGDRVE